MGTTVTGMKVIVLSHDVKYKNLLAANLRKSIEIDVIVNVYNPAQAKAAMSRTAPSILVLDMENQPVNDAFLDMLRQGGVVHIIAIGFKPGINFARHNIRDMMHKPIGETAMMWNVHTRDMVKRIQSFVSAMSAPVMDSLSGAVNVHEKIIVMASSTGGTEALPVVLGALPARMPPILIVQHMPSAFTRQFAARLDKLSKIRVKEAVNGDYLRMGTALVAPGDFHMKLVKQANKLAVITVTGDKVLGVRPSADVLFQSVGEIMDGRNVLGVILTGMGADGAKGLYDLHRKGAATIGQDKASSVVYGMPKAAFDMGAIDYQLPLESIAGKIMAMS